MIKQDDLKALEEVFALARQASVNNEQLLANLINYKADLLKRLETLVPKEEKFSEEVKRKLTNKKK